MPRLLLCTLVLTALLTGCTFSPGTGPDDDIAPGDGQPPPPTDDPRAARLETIRPATWLVVGYSDLSNFTATAFAVGPRHFATTARIARSVERVLGEPGARAYLFQHESGARRTITGAWVHPGFAADAAALTTPDVALLEAPAEDTAAEITFDPLPLAAADTLADLYVLEELIVCGFPPTASLGLDLARIVLEDADYRPRATSVIGTISALRPLDPTSAASPANTRLLQLVLPQLVGLSGSPLVNDSGQLVGLHVGTASTGESIHFGLRAEVLAELIALVESNDVPELLGTP